MDIVTPIAASDEEHLLVEVSALANGFARRLVARDAADDLAQEVVLDCLVRLRTGRWRIDTTLEAFVASTTWRQHAYAMRRVANRRSRDAQHLAERSARDPAWMDPALSFDAHEDDVLLKRALAELPAGCRAAWVLVREDGATYRNVARRLGISCGLVASHVTRAEQHLAARLLGIRSCHSVPPTVRRPTRRRRRPGRRRTSRRAKASTMDAPPTSNAAETTSNAGEMTSNAAYVLPTGARTTPIPG